MKFMLTFKMKPDTKQQSEAFARFLNAAGKAPAGAKLLGRWTKLDFSGGFVLLESETPKPLLDFSLWWSDLMELSLVPVVEDQELADAVLDKYVMP